MNEDTALSILGLDKSYDKDSVTAEYHFLRMKLNERLDAAPNSLQSKYEESLHKLDDAYAYLLNKLESTRSIDIKNLPVSEKHVAHNSTINSHQDLRERYTFLSEDFELLNGWHVFPAVDPKTESNVFIRVFANEFSESDMLKAEHQISDWKSIQHKSFEKIIDFNVNEKGVFIVSHRDEEGEKLSQDSFHKDRRLILQFLRELEDILIFLSFEKGYACLSITSIRQSHDGVVLAIPGLSSFSISNGNQAHYLAPELKRSRMVSKKADLYAVAMLAAELLIGKSLGLNGARVIEKSQLSKNTKKVLISALHDNPSKRHDEISTFIDDLENSYTSIGKKLIKHPLTWGVITLVFASIVFFPKLKNYANSMVVQEDIPITVDDFDDQKLVVKKMAESNELIKLVGFFKVDLSRAISTAEKEHSRLITSGRESKTEIKKSEKNLKEMKLRLEYFFEKILDEHAMLDIKSSMAVVDNMYKANEFDSALALINPVHEKLEHAFVISSDLDTLLSTIGKIEGLQGRIHANTLPESTKEQEKTLLEKETSLLESNQYQLLLGEVYTPLLDLYEVELKRVQSVATKKKGERTKLYLKEIASDMVLIPAGEFKMGLRKAGATDSRPIRVVSISSFHIGRFPVTNRIFNFYLTQKGKKSNSPSDHPVTNVTWGEVVEFTKWLSKISGEKYRLPTEAEWEYVARTKIKTVYPWGNVVGKNHANCEGCGSQWDGKSTSPAGSFKANQFGLFDLSGNVWEWTQDCYLPNYRNAPVNGVAVEFPKCEQRSVRGGGWNTSAKKLHPALRSTAPMNTELDSLGFRLARVLR